MDRLRRSTIHAIARKEFLKIRRDRRTLAVIIILPILMLLIYGFGIRYDVSDVTVALLDQDRSPASRSFLRLFFTTGYFVRAAEADSYQELVRMVDSGRARMGVVLPVDFGRRVTRREKVKVQTLLDGTDNNTASIALGYFNAIAQSYSLDIITDRLHRTMYPPPFQIPALKVESRVWYNPDMLSSHFIVPGIIAIIMMMVGAILTALTIVQEKELGTIEPLLASPVRPEQLIIGKLIPYVLIAMIDMMLIVAVAWVVFGVPIKGSFLLLFCMGLLYLTNVLGIGVLVSTLTDSVQSAMLGAMLLSLLPSILLSGFVFPIENLPAILQWISFIVPARYFLEVIRGIYLKGIGLSILWPQVIFMVLFAAGVLGLSTLRLKRRLD